MVSLLYGNLFFILCRKTLELINNFSFESLSCLCFSFCIFFRIFQTHILAALKYSNSWKLQPLDFILTFVTALFGYVLFEYEKIETLPPTFPIYLIISFCIFGIVGYAITYLRTCQFLESEVRRTERRLHATNISCLLVIGVLFAITLFLNSEAMRLITNIISSFVLLVNIYLSIWYSRDFLKNNICL